MDSIKKFLDFCLFENALQVTSDWYVSTNGQDMAKRSNNGYLFLESGTLSIIYKLKDGSESRIDFYGKSEDNAVKTSLVSSDGKTIESSPYTELNPEDVVSIIYDFINRCKTEEQQKYVTDRMIMGLSKTLIAFYRTDYMEQSPVSYRTFVKVLESISSNEIKKPGKYDSQINELTKKFISQVRDHIEKKE
jgi:hypothetical protein